MLAAVIVLMGLFVCYGLSLLRPGPVSALALTVFSAAWLSANNGHLEGPLLYSFDPERGLSASDLLSVAGFVLALVALARWLRHSTHRTRNWVTAAAIIIVFGSGVVLDWVHQPG